MRIEPIDVSDQAALREAVAVESRATAAVRPAWTPLPVAARLRSLVDPAGWSTHLIGARDGDRLVGVGRAMVAQDTPDTGWVFADVDPPWWRRGLGTRLVQAAALALPARVQRVVSRAYRSGHGDLELLQRDFAAPLGFAPASRETVVELELREAMLPAPALPPGYRVHSFVDGVPDALRPAVGVLIGRVDAEAPNGTLAWDPTPVSPAQYVSGLQERRGQGRVTVETVALDPDGEPVAWTCVVAPPNTERSAEIEGTYVLPAHRGRGLGAAVKSACLTRLRAVSPVSRVITSSDDENRWMRAINGALGFRTLEAQWVFERRSG